MRQAGIREARQRLSKLLSFVQNGHEVVITDRGQPVARLVAPLPLSSRPFPRRAGLRRGMPRLHPPIPETLSGHPQPPRRRGAGVIPRGPCYLDGTALATLYLPDEWSATLERHVAGRRDITVSELSVTEVMTAFGLRGAELRSAPKLGARLHAALLDDLESGCFRRVEASPSTHRAAQRLALSLGARHPLRPRQALHLALAMTAGVGNLVSFDPALAKAAQIAGLSVVPGQPA